MLFIVSASVTFLRRFGANQRDLTQERIACPAPPRSRPNGSTASGAIWLSFAGSATRGVPQNWQALERASLWVRAPQPGQANWLAARVRTRGLAARKAS